MDETSDGQTYDTLTIALHWIVALLVIGLWTAGQTVGWLPKGPIRSFVWSTHVVAGFGVALALVIRVTWRLTAGRRLPAVGAAAGRLLASGVQLGLYILLLAVVGLGVANAFNRGFDLYGLAKLPQLGDLELKHQLTKWHGLAANILMALAAFHAVAALAHHFVWKDQVLRRMRPGSAP